MKKTISLFFISSSILSFAGNDNQCIGSRSNALGNASVTLSDVWSTSHNQAGLGFMKNISTGVYYENRFLLNAISLKAAAFAIPVKAGCFGLSFSNFGYSLYNENKIGLAFGKAFGENISAGVQLDYVNAKIGENYGSKSSFVAEIGLQFRMIKNLTIGTHVYNITRAKFADYNNEKIPTIMRVGIDYKFSEQVFVAVEMEKDIDHKAVFKAGMEYHVLEVLYIRAGISTNPTLSCFGFGLKIKNFKVDASSSFHSVLGFSPQIGLSYDFN